MSSYWMPLASLCMWPLPGAPGSAGVAGAGAEAAGVEVAVVLCSLTVPAFSVVSLQAARPVASATARARYRFDMRDSFPSGPVRKLAHCNDLRNRYCADTGASRRRVRWPMTSLEASGEGSCRLRRRTGRSVHPSTRRRSTLRSPVVEISNLVVARYLDGRVSKGVTRDFS